MELSFEETLIEVWRQTLVENADMVVLGTERYPVRRTPKRRLRQVDFVFDGNEIRGLEQNPDTKSRWAQMARSGKKVMQFPSEGRYGAVVVDGKTTLYVRESVSDAVQPSRSLPFQVTTEQGLKLRLPQQEARAMRIRAGVRRSKNGKIPEAIPD